MARIMISGMPTTVSDLVKIVSMPEKIFRPPKIMVGTSQNVVRKSLKSVKIDRCWKRCFCNDLVIVSDKCRTVFDHCLRALVCGLQP